MKQVQLGLHLPPTSDGIPDPEQNPPMFRRQQIHCHDTLETQSTVVLQGCQSVSTAAGEAACPQSDGLVSGRVPEHPQHSHRKVDQVCRLDAYRQGRPEVGGLSPGALSTLQQSWAKATQESYGLGFRYWTQFCRQHQLDEAAPSSVNLINFLQHEYEVNKKQYRTINSYRSATSTTLGTCPKLGIPIGQDPMVCRFMRGVHRLRPPKSKNFPKLGHCDSAE